MRGLFDTFRRHSAVLTKFQVNVTESRLIGQEAAFPGRVTRDSEAGPEGPCRGPGVVVPGCPGALCRSPPLRPPAGAYGPASLGSAPLYRWLGVPV